MTFSLPLFIRTLDSSQLLKNSHSKPSKCTSYTPLFNERELHVVELEPERLSFNAHFAGVKINVDVHTVGGEEVELRILEYNA